MPGSDDGGIARLRARLGSRLGGIRFHAIEFGEGPDGSPRVARRRRWFAPALIPAANLRLRLEGAGVRVLPDPEWRARERAILRGLDGLEPGTGPGGRLILPRWPGAVLAELAGDRLRGLEAAARALFDLHRVEMPGPGGVPARLSHGDATALNVLFAPATGRACWFGFDTAHDPGRPAIWCVGDDLRALICSAVAAFADVPVGLLLRAARDGYPVPEPWRELGGRAAREGLGRSLFHAARGWPAGARRRELAALLQGLGKSGQERNPGSKADAGVRPSRNQPRSTRGVRPRTRSARTSAVAVASWSPALLWPAATNRPSQPGTGPR